MNMRKPHYPLRTDHQLSETEKLQSLAEERGLLLEEEDISKLLTILDETPEVRKKETERIKAKVARGNYKIPSEAVCSAILRDSVVNQESRYYLPAEDKESISRVAYLLKRVPRGETHWQLFHKLGALCVPAIFEEDLSSPLVEPQGSDGSVRMDLVLYNSAVNGFWHDMKERHGITHVGFEFKNWNKEDHIRFAGQLGRYSRRNRGVVLVTRDKPSKSMLHECSELFRNSAGFLPLAISDEAIYLASTRKDQGSSPSSIFEEPYLRLQMG